MMSMAYKEGLSFPPAALNKVIVTANQDVRQVRMHCHSALYKRHIWTEVLPVLLILRQITRESCYGLFLQVLLRCLVCIRSCEFELCDCSTLQSQSKCHWTVSYILASVLCSVRRFYIIMNEIHPHFNQFCVILRLS